MKCNAVISPICESKMSTQQSATEVYCCGVRGREMWEPSVASSESSSELAVPRREDRSDGGWFALVYVSARVRSHIRIVASVEPVAMILSSICRQRTEATLD
jgi:hypothetical protein